MISKRMVVIVEMLKISEILEIPPLNNPFPVPKLVVGWEQTGLHPGRTNSNDTCRS